MTTTYTNRRQLQGGSWVVTETTDDGHPPVTVFLAGSNDMTAGLPVSYDSRCSSCYLGHAHSQLYHKLNVARS